MSEPMPEIKLLRPTSLCEAIALRKRHAGSRILGGGTDLIVNMRRGLVEPCALVDISAIPELGSIEATADGVRIGAGATLSRLADHEHVRMHYGAIAEAARSIAGPGHRTCATVGGNLCLDTRCLYYNQSRWWRESNSYCLKYKGDTCHVAPQGRRCRAAFCGDLAPTLLVHEAEVEIAGPQGARRMPLTDLYRDDGAAHLTLADHEMLVSVLLPASHWRSAYAKVGVRDSIDFPLAGVAAAIRPEGSRHARLRLGITGTDSQPLLLDGTDGAWPMPPDDAALTRIEKLVQKQVSPMRTTTIAAHYRRLAASALARRLVVQLAAEQYT